MKQSHQRAPESPREPLLRPTAKNRAGHQRRIAFCCGYLVRTLPHVGDLSRVFKPTQALLTYIAAELYIGQRPEVQRKSMLSRLFSRAPPRTGAKRARTFANLFLREGRPTRVWAGHPGLVEIHRDEYEQPRFELSSPMPEATSPERQR